MWHPPLSQNPNGLACSKGARTVRNGSVVGSIPIESTMRVVWVLHKKQDRYIRVPAEVVEGVKTSDELQEALDNWVEDNRKYGCVGH